MPSRTFHRKRKHRRAKKAGPYGKQLTFYKKSRYAMYRSPRMIMPQEYVTTLRFGVSKVSAPVGVASPIYKVGIWKSDPYDVDDAFASTVMPGFTELAAFYAKYRTLRMGYKLTCENREDFPQTIVAFLGPQVLQTASSTTTLASVGNPLARSMTLSAKYGIDNKTIKANHSIVAISGTRNSLFADDWEGDTAGSAVPPFPSTLARIMYLNVFSESNTAVTLGVEVQAVITLTVQFSYPRWLST